MDVTAPKTYRTASGYHDSKGGYESLQVEVSYQAEMHEDSWRPPYRLRNIDPNSRRGSRGATVERARTPWP